jgi:hypothetical protein
MLHAGTSDIQKGNMGRRSSVAPPTPSARETDSAPTFAGNQARLRAGPSGVAALLQPSRTTALQRQCACGGAPESDKREKEGLQAKLEIGPVDDPLEREADSVADSVMQGLGSAPDAAVTGSAQRKISRQAASVIAYDSVAPKEEEEANAETPAPLQRSPNATAASVPGNFEHALNAKIASRGERLPPHVGAFMGEQFSRDFSGVRIHHDAAADALSASIGARAFTIGKDIMFARQSYRPESRTGQHLIAHELTHVVQQDASTGTVARKIQRAPSCASYPGYDASADIAKYNCAGLALRTYNFTYPSSTVVSELVSLHPDGQSTTCGSACAAGQIKYWLWEYDIETADASGKAVPKTRHPDFHIVAGMTPSSGKDPTNVYSKNGARPVHGTGTGPSFRPPAFAQYLSNDAAEAPVPGKYVNRLNITDTCFCTGC